MIHDKTLNLLSSPDLNELDYNSEMNLQTPDLNTYGSSMTPEWGGYFTMGQDIIEGLGKENHRQRGKDIGGGIGGILGTAVAPGIGTAIGSGLGRLAGGLIGDNIEDKKELRRDKVAGAKEDIYRNMYEDVARLNV